MSAKVSCFGHELWQFIELRRMQYRHYPQALSCRFRCRRLHLRLHPREEIEFNGLVLPTSPASSHCSRHCCSSLNKGNLNLMFPPVSECFCRQWWSISVCCDVCCMLHRSRDSWVWLHPKILDFPSIMGSVFRSQAACAAYSRAAAADATQKSRAALRLGTAGGGVASATATDLFMFQLRVQECSTQTTPRHHLRGSDCPIALAR